MARPIRIQYAGAVYHVMARGNHGQAVFGDDTDRKVFLETLGEAMTRAALSTGGRAKSNLSLQGTRWQAKPRR